MGPTWVLSAPDGSHVGPMNLAIRGDLFSLIIPCITRLTSVVLLYHVIERWSYTIVVFVTMYMHVTWCPVDIGTSVEYAVAMVTNICLITGPFLFFCYLFRKFLIYFILRSNMFPRGPCTNRQAEVVIACHNSTPECYIVHRLIICEMITYLARRRN